MNLEKLFAQQKILRDRIGYNQPDRFDKLILALLVEIGECANEWRGFKFWSKNQKPRVEITAENTECEYCFYNNVGKNPLLEEYVDGLHFVLEIGLELNTTDIFISDHSIYQMHMSGNVTDKFNKVIAYIYKVMRKKNKYWYDVLLESFIGLGYSLGFTWEQIVQAYFEKNAINHQRQEQGY